MTTELPSGWASATIDEVCDVVLGQSPPGSSYNGRGKGTPFLQGKAEFGDRFPNIRKWTTEPKKHASVGSVLLSVRAPVGPTNVAPVDCAIGRGLAALHPLGGISTEYLLWVIRQSVSDLIEQATGSTFEAITSSQLRSHRVAIAPPAEQERIVAAIEEQFSRLDSASDAIAAAQARIEVSRRSVLVEAFAGRLAPQDPNDETASVLLDRIAADRRGEPTTQGTRPGPSRVTRDLPSGWAWARLEDLAAAMPRAITDGPFGSNLKTAHYTDNGPRVIRLQNIGDGVFRHEDAHISEEHYLSLVQHSVQEGDLIVASLGETLPRACLVPNWVPPAIVKADCIRVRLHPDVDSSYVNFALRHPSVRKQTSTVIKGVGRPRLGLKGIRNLAVPLAPHAEQQRVVAVIEEHFSRLDAASQAILVAKARIEGLRRGVLSEAFTGRLVPQDPIDESATVLLERIAGSR